MRFYNFKSFHNDVIYIEWADFGIGDLCNRKETDLLLCLGHDLWWYDKAEYIYITKGAEEAEKAKIVENAENMLDLILDSYDPQKIKSENIDNIYINKVSNIDISLPNIYIRYFLTSKTMEIIHILARMYFTDIWHIIKLRIHDIDSILKHKKEKPKLAKKIKLQNLYVYSDGWTIANSNEMDWAEFTEIISTYPTEVQQSKLFWKIKNAEIVNLVCTHGIMFQDWANLENIYIYDSRRQYYKNQKDPRYESLEVVKVMVDIYCAKLHIM